MQWQRGGSASEDRVELVVRAVGWIAGKAVAR